MEIYDKVFQDKNYNLFYEDKLDDVRKWVAHTRATRLLDVGCGRGHYLKYFFLKTKIKVYGVEPSKYICENDLKGWPVYNTDILGAKPDSYDALYCMDVLEHLKPEELNDNLLALKRLAPKALIGIANHPDNWEGVELHKIQEDKAWWAAHLQDVYREVTLIKEYERFYLFSCSV